MLKSPLAQARLHYKPSLPSLLSQIDAVIFRSITAEAGVLPEIAAAFPEISSFSLLKGEGSLRAKRKIPLRVGVVFSGGPAAGGHNVIAGLWDALRTLHPHSELVGFLNGPQGIVKNQAIYLTQDLIDSCRNQGGFDLIGSGRTKIETSEHLALALAAVSEWKLDGLVIIGGDDSNTNAALLADYFLQKKSCVKVVGIPKTIDGDLQNRHVAISFGFDTAAKTYAELIGNIARDAPSSRKYYHFIKLMGRSASHLALECALLTCPNLVCVAEERKTLAEVVSLIADLVVARAKLGKSWGVILIPEGLIEFMPDVAALIQDLTLQGEPSSVSLRVWDQLPQKIQHQLLKERDPHGNIAVSGIDTEELLMEMVVRELKNRQFEGAFNPVAHFFGYEGRCALPSNFDANYCFALGFVAAALLDQGYTGYMAFVGDLKKAPEEWSFGAVPLAQLMHVENRAGKIKPVIAKALVDLEGNIYQIYKKQASSWRLEDHYLCPGPIQFFGNTALINTTPLLLN